MIFSNKQLQKFLKAQDYQAVIDWCRAHLKNKNLSPKDQSSLISLITESQRQLRALPSAVNLAYCLFIGPDGSGICLPASLKLGNKGLWKSDFRAAVEKGVLAALSLLGQSKRMTHADYRVELPEGQERYNFKGRSIGLSVALLYLSLYLKQPLPSDVAISAAIDEQGRLQPVEEMPQKVAAAEARGHIRKIIVAAEQTRVETALEWRPFECLQDVVIELWGESFYNSRILPFRDEVEENWRAYRFYYRLQNNQEIERICRVLQRQLSSATDALSKSRLAAVKGELGAQLTHKADNAPEARKLFEESIALIEELGSLAHPEVNLANVYAAYAIWLNDQLDFDAALAQVERGIRWMEIRHYPDYLQIQCWNTRGQILSQMGRYEEAEAEFRKSLEPAERGDYSQLARIHCYRLQNFTLAGDWNSAKSAWEEADKATRPHELTQHFFNTFWKLYAAFYFNRADWLEESFRQLCEERLAAVHSNFPVHVWLAYSYFYSALKEQLPEKEQAKIGDSIHKPRKPELLRYKVSLDLWRKCQGLSPVFFPDSEITANKQILLARYPALQRRLSLQDADELWERELRL
ncbi:MAG: hypothetical protein Kow0037_30940 [Calditrichia bacterium]